MMLWVQARRRATMDAQAGNPPLSADEEARLAALTAGDRTADKP
jgi:hypothetical protein